jgi:hypothetical protein
MNYLAVLIFMLNMGVQGEICVCEFVCRVNKSGKPTNLDDILYWLNVIFLQRVF